MAAQQGAKTLRSAPDKWESDAERAKGEAIGKEGFPEQVPAGGRGAQRPVNRTRHGGGFNPSVNPTVNISVVKGATHTPQKGAQGVPGGDFMSNEDIRAFCEHGRKDSRKRAVERALDAEMLQGRLANIPDSFGTMSGARMRARRVTRWLKRIAQAEKLIAKWYSALYSAFEREYESELMKIGKARTQQRQPSKFGWR
jgi:hypothetical protein